MCDGHKQMLSMRQRNLRLSLHFTIVKVWEAAKVHCIVQDETGRSSSDLILLEESLPLQTIFRSPLSESFLLHVRPVLNLGAMYGPLLMELTTRLFDRLSFPALSRIEQPAALYAFTCALSYFEIDLLRPMIAFGHLLTDVIH